MVIQLATAEQPLPREVRREVQVVEVGGTQYAAFQVRGQRYLVKEGPSSVRFELHESGRAPGELLAVRTDAPYDSLRATFVVEDDEEGGEVVVVRS